MVALATGVYKPSLNLGDVGDVQLNPFAPGESVPVKPGEDIFTRDGIIVPDGGAVDDFKLPARRFQSMECWKVRSSRAHEGHGSLPILECAFPGRLQNFPAPLARFPVPSAGNS